MPRKVLAYFKYSGCAHVWCPNEKVYTWSCFRYLSFSPKIYSSWGQPLHVPHHRIKVRTSRRQSFSLLKQLGHRWSGSSTSTVLRQIILQMWGTKQRIFVRAWLTTSHRHWEEENVALSTDMNTRYATPTYHTAYTPALPARYDRSIVALQVTLRRSNRGHKLPMIRISEHWMITRCNRSFYRGVCVRNKLELPQDKRVIARKCIARVHVQSVPSLQYNSRQHLVRACCPLLQAHHQGCRSTR